jgi:DNA-binding NtrC family response regulator
MENTSQTLGRTRERLVVYSRSMREVVAAVSRTALSTRPVFVDGEDGTGRKLAARAIHDEGPRASQPFAMVRAETLVVEALDRILFGDPRTGAIGKFEEAADGTLLLADLEGLNPVAQERLLTVLEEERFATGLHEMRCIGFRLICTGNREKIEKQIKLARFSEDLFRRVAVETLRMPSLAERKDDIPHLVTAILHDLSLRERIEMPTVPYHYMELLMDVSWPENVRQLRNHVESVMVLSGGAFDPQIIREHFVPEGQPATIRGAIESLIGRLRGVTANLAVNNGTQK